MFKNLFKVITLLIIWLPFFSCSKEDKPKENRPPGEFKIESIQYENQNYTVNWTSPSDPDDDLITFDIYIDNEKIVSKTINQSIDGILPYNSTHSGRIIATDSHGGNSETNFTLEMPTSEILFFADIEANFYAFDIRTREVLWTDKMNAQLRQLHSTIGDQIFINYEDLSSQDILTGEIKWKKESTFHIQYDSWNISTDGNAIYRKLHDNGAERLDPETGEIKWSVSVLESKGPMGFDDKNVYLIDRNAPDLKVYDKVSGERKWSFVIPYEIDEFGEQFGHTPIIHENKIYLRSTSGFLYVLSNESGELLWKKRLTSHISNYHGNESVPILNDNDLFIVALDKIYSLDKDTGNTNWVRNLGTRVYSSPFLYQNHIYFSSDENLFCLNASTGEIKWTRNMPTFLQISPIVYENIIYTGGNGFYYALNTNDGSEVWRHPIDTYSVTSPTLVIGESEEVIYPSLNPSTN